MNVFRKMPWAKALIAVTMLLISTFTFGEDTEQEMRKAFSSSEYQRPSSIPYRPENPYTEAKAELGHVLFFDQRLSQSRNQSCVSCHHPGLGWEMGIPKAIGFAQMPRKAQTLLNLAWSDSWFWDGRSNSFGEQFHTAMTSAKAMALSSDELVSRLEAIPGYRSLFKAAFSDAKINEKNVADALEIFERGIVSKESAFDRWVKGESSALNPSAKRGALIFAGKGQCMGCHSGWNFTDNGFHDIGMADADLGRGAKVKIISMQHAFKTPTLRDVEQRAPFMHDGSLATLEDVVDHYNKGGQAKRPSLAPELKNLHLSRREKADLVEFLKALSAPVVPVEFPRMPM